MDLGVAQDEGKRAQKGSVYDQLSDFAPPTSSSCGPMDKACAS